MIKLVEMKCQEQVQMCAKLLVSEWVMSWRHPAMQNGRMLYEHERGYHDDDENVKEEKVENEKAE